MITKVFISFHRVLGTLLSILFVMWFLSGMVMMYHTYPSIDRQQELANSEAIGEGSMPDIGAVSILHDGRISDITLERKAGQNIMRIGTDDGELAVDAASGKTISRLDSSSLHTIASAWSKAHPVLKDTLNEIDVWLIGAMPFNEYPVYHYTFDDGKGTELYLSSRTGRALQLIDSESRMWAWLGAIPHWIYITKLRATGRQPWTDTVLWLSGIGIVMTLTGIVAGIRSTVMARRRKKITPYAKSLFRWHHVFGLCFGLFVLTWIFSGFMSLADAPQAIWRTHTQRSAKDICSDSISLDKFTLDYKKIVAGGDIKRLSFTEIGGMPFYHVWTADDEYLVAADDTTARKTTLTADDCRKIVSHTHSGKEEISVELMNTYDNYYVSQKRPLPLPVYKVSVSDADRSTYYINPTNGNASYYNTNKRAGKWMYTGLHALNTPYFAEHQHLRRAILWVLLVGGTIVSATGLVMGAKYLNRLRRRMMR